MGKVRTWHWDSVTLCVLLWAARVTLALKGFEDEKTFQGCSANKPSLPSASTLTRGLS